MARYALLALAALLAAPRVAAAAPPWKKDNPENAAGRGAYERGDFGEAAQRFEKLGQTLEDDDKARAAFNRGDALYRAGDFAGAQQAFDEAARTGDPFLRGDAFFNQGLSREQTQDSKGAIEAYRRALLENPKHVPARTNLERLLRMPPPPPQQQPQPSPESQAEQQPGDENQPPQEEQPGQGEEKKPPPEQPPDEQRPAPSDKLTEKEADDILRAADQDKDARPPLNTGKPPRDYDPEKDW